MSLYTPDGIIILKIINEGDTIFKVFSSWSGGYLDSDSWRLNSGISKVEYDNEYFYFYGYSGSVVQINKSGGRVSGYNMGVVSEYLNKDYVTEVPLDRCVGMFRTHGIEVVEIKE